MHIYLNASVRAQIHQQINALGKHPNPDLVSMEKSNGCVFVYSPRWCLIQFGLESHLSLQGMITYFNVTMETEYLKQPSPSSAQKVQGQVDQSRTQNADDHKGLFTQKQHYINLAHGCSSPSPLTAVLLRIKIFICERAA